MELTTANLADYEEEIPWNDLPATLKDAAVATNLLGMRYLWIDSLCIIQDDATDKIREIGQMNKVYTHATLTIKARRGDKATDGFLHPRSLPSGTSMLQYEDGRGQRGWVTLTFKSTLKSEESTALDTRGWVMQEYVLSRRLVVFGTWSTEWSCRKERRVHSDGWIFSDFTSGNPFQRNDRWELSDVLAESAEAQLREKINRLDAALFFSANPTSQIYKPCERDLIRTWYDLVTAYSARSLSVTTDRILAISGLAEVFAPTVYRSSIRHARQPQPDRYVAGLWESELPNSLLWQRASKISTPRPNEYPGPSWSWVAIDGAIWTEQKQDETCIEKFAIEVVLSDATAPFGAVESATLDIEGEALAIEWRYKRHEHWPLSADSSEWKFPKKLWDHSTSEFKLSVKLDAREDDTDWRRVFLLSFRHNECGIVLKEDIDGRYRRLGYYHCDNSFGFEKKRFTVV
ncbi:HET domain-containing protein [Colletotrichum kahawae]|uniref:HET domain-containing protein n=1 Tax=Colletotrichum kahawae TaxID=34407 RepID=A0AAD9YPH7_COLKA|nr:HET domain-containing protein [Colletotrichum kahawae]